MAGGQNGQESGALRRVLVPAVIVLGAALLALALSALAYLLLGRPGPGPGMATPAPLSPPGTPVARPSQAEGAPAIATLLPGPTTRPAPELFVAEWPAFMQQDRSDTVRLTLHFADGASIPSATLAPGHTGSSATPAPVGTPGVALPDRLGPGYDLAVAARLDAPGFAAQPAGDQAYRIFAGQDVTWVWTVLPQGYGTQVMSLNATARWQPRPGQGGDIVQYPVYQQSLSTYVQVPTIARPDPLNLTTVLASVLGALLGWLGARLAEPWLAAWLDRQTGPGKTRSPQDRRRSSSK